RSPPPWRARCCPPRPRTVRPTSWAWPAARQAWLPAPLTPPTGPRVTRRGRPRAEARRARSEDALGHLGSELAGFDHHVQLAHLGRREPVHALGQGEEPVLLVLRDDTIGQRTELLDVLRSREGAGSQGVRVGHGDLVLDDRAVAQRDHDAPAERLLVGVVRVVAAGPLGVLDGAPLAPQPDGVGPLGALGRVALLVVPGAVLESDGEDVHDRVVEGLAAGLGVELLRVVRASADHVVGVVAGVDDHRLDSLEVADARPHAPGEVYERLALVLGRVLLRVGLEGLALRLAGLGQRHVVARVGAREQPGDHAVLALVDR